LNHHHVRWKRLEHEGIDEAKNGGIGADTHGHAGCCGGCESRSLPHIADGISKVLAKCCDPRESGLVAARILGACQAAETAQHLAASFLRSCTGGGFARSHIEVKPALVDVLSSFGRAARSQTSDPRHRRLLSEAQKTPRPARVFASAPLRQQLLQAGAGSQKLLDGRFRKLPLGTYPVGLLMQ
jgi:hypothetical protein